MALRSWLVCGLGLVALLAASALHAADSSPKSDARLLGPWHTVSIDGDALFLVIRGVELVFEKDGKFTAHVSFTDGQSETAHGHYQLSGDRIDFTVPQLKGKESATYKVEGDELAFHDDSFGVTVKIARGKLKDSSGFHLF